ncbi:unnamed protein product [Lota lota]
MVLLLATVLLLASQTTSAQSMDRMQKQRTQTTGSMSQVSNQLLQIYSNTKGDTQQEAEVVSMVTGGARMELERSVETPNNMPPRDRKAGCKNFYWKGFTSC